MPLGAAEPAQAVGDERQLAMAGSQAAQPIAETTLPAAPALSAMRVPSPMVEASYCLAVDG